MDVPLDLFERGSFEIGSSASDLSAQFLLPKWRMGEIIMDSTHVTLETIDQTFFGTMTAEIPDPRPAWMFL